VEVAVYSDQGGDDRFGSGGGDRLGLDDGVARHGSGGGYRLGLGGGDRLGSDGGARLGSGGGGRLGCRDSYRLGSGGCDRLGCGVVIDSDLVAALFSDRVMAMDSRRCGGDGLGPGDCDRSDGSDRFGDGQIGCGGGDRLGCDGNDRLGCAGSDRLGSDSDDKIRCNGDDGGRKCVGNSQFGTEDGGGLDNPAGRQNTAHSVVIM
jgi:hypothetical protein